MPNLVLEISQCAIPMILTDTAVLRDTFNDGVFLSASTNHAETAARFAAALDQIAAMDEAASAVMINAARECAFARHSPVAHARAVADIFGLS